MSPARVIVPCLLKPGARHPVPSDARHHLLDVLRLRGGDEVVVVDRDGRAFRARLVREKDDWTMEVVAPEPGARAVREGVRVRLLMGLLKADRTEWAVRKATEMGVGEVRVVVCERSIPRTAPSEAERRLLRMRRVVAEAARQCGRATIPDIGWYGDLGSAIPDVQAGGPRFTLDESPTSRPLAACLRDAPLDEIWLAVGPEGSFSPAEREALARAGFEPAGLGPRVLRAETAAMVAVTVVQVVAGDLSGRSVRINDLEGA